MQSKVFVADTHFEVADYSVIQYRIAVHYQICEVFRK